MKQFCDFLKQNGIPNANALVSFLDNFSKYPEMVLDMSDAEINHYEAQMDSAIGVVRQCSDNSLSSRKK